MEYRNRDCAAAGEMMAGYTQKGVVVRRYTRQDEEALFRLMMREGEEWKGYWGDAGRVMYRRALQNSITYLIHEEGQLCGFARCKHDDGFGLYVFDLLVDKAYRGKEYGRLLMEYASREFPDEPAYVMSDVDPYYEKLGYLKEGTIFIIASF